MELEEHIAIESTGHRTPNYPNLTDSTLFFASGGRDVVRGSLTVKHIVSRPEDFVIGKARPFCLAMKHLQKDLLVPHLKAKVDLIGGSYDETSWLLPDQRLLRDCESLVLRDASLDPIRPFLLELIRGMLTHSQHRPDILELNAGRVIPENGPLIREMYELADNASIQESNKLLTFLNTKDVFTDAVLRCDIRRLIRNIVRVGATRHNVKRSAYQSLKSAMTVFIDRDSSSLSELGFLPLLQELKHFTSNKSEKDKIMKRLDVHFIRVFSQPLIHPSQETLLWLDTQFQGFSFSDLVEKNMIQRGTLEASLNRISETSSNANSDVTKKMSQEPVTKVTSQYKNDMVKYALFRQAFTSSRLLKYELVELQKEK